MATAPSQSSPETAASVEHGLSFEPKVGARMRLKAHGSTAILCENILPADAKAEKHKPLQKTHLAQIQKGQGFTILEIGTDKQEGKMKIALDSEGGKEVWVKFSAIPEHHAMEWVEEAREGKPFSSGRLDELCSDDVAVQTRESRGDLRRLMVKVVEERAAIRKFEAEDIGEGPGGYIG